MIFGFDGKVQIRKFAKKNEESLVIFGFGGKDQIRKFAKKMWKL